MFFPSSPTGTKIPNQRGSTLVAGLLASVLVLGASTVAYKNFNLSKDTFRSARVKNMMAVTAAQVTRRSLQPEAYRDCVSTSGVGSCRINDAFFSDLRNRAVLGAQCDPPGSGCGIRLVGPTLTYAPPVGTSPAVSTFSAEIHYDGLEARIKPSIVTQTIPVEVLQTGVFHCGKIDPSRPVFVGFNADGSPRCEGFNECPRGQFVKGIDISGRNLTCAAIPTSADCGSGRMFSHFNWNGETGIDYGCEPLPDPPFQSDLAVRATASEPVQPQIHPVINNTTVTTTSTSTTTTTPTATTTTTTTSTATGMKWRYMTYAEMTNGTAPAVNPMITMTDDDGLGYHVSSADCPKPSSIDPGLAGFFTATISPDKPCSAPKRCSYSQYSHGAMGTMMAFACD